MSDEQDPRRGGPDGHEEPGLVEHVEHVVEGVREEVHELHDKIETAVEQALPARVRWTAGRIATLILLSLAVLIGGAIVAGLAYLRTHSVWAAGELSRLLNQTLSEHSNVVLEMKDIRGNPLQRMTVIAPKVRFRDGDSPPLLEASSMTVAYTPWNLWVGKRRSIEVVLDHPVLRLTRRADGTLQLPEWRAGKKASGASRELEVLLQVRGATLSLPDTAWDVVGGNLQAHVVTGRRTELAIQKASWAKGPLATRLQSLVASVAMGDSIAIQLQELTTPELALHGSAGWSGEHPVRHLHLEVDHVTWRWLARAFDNGVFDVPGSGQGTIDASGSSTWLGRADIRADWDSLAVGMHGAFGWNGHQLRVEPLALSSRAGNLNGHFLYSTSEWDVGGEVKDADPQYWAPIQLAGWPAGRAAGRMRLHSVRHGDRNALHFDADLGATELAGWRADSGRVVVESPIAGPDTFSVRTVRRGGWMSLGGRLEPGGGWTGRWEAAGLPLDEWPDGRASGIHGVLEHGRGSVTSRDTGLAVTGTLEGSAADWLGIHAARWRMESASGRLLPAPDLGASVRLADVLWLGVHFDSVACPVRIGAQRLALADLSAAAGDTLVTAAGAVDWDPHGWRVQLDRARAKSAQFDWVADPPLLLSGDPHGASFERFVAKDGAARLELAGRWALPSGTYDWTASGDSLNLGRLGLPDSLGLSGRGRARLHVTGLYGDPRFHFEGSAEAPGLRGHRLDRLELALDGRPRALEVTRLLAALHEGRLTGHMRFDDTKHPWPDTLTAPGVVRWLTGSGRWSGELSADSLPIEPLASVAPQVAGWGGRLSGTLVVGGRPADPDLDLKLAARPLLREPLQMDAAELTASYRGGRLSVPELRLTRGDVVSRIHGEMPIVLRADAPPRVPEQPMSWHVDLEKGDLGLVPLFVPQLAQARGVVDLHAEVSGTPQHPVLQGSAQVRKGVVVPAGREEVLEGVEADLRLGASTITLDRFVAHQGRRGLITGSGAIRLEGARLKDYRFALTMKEFTSGQSGLYVAQFSSVDSLIVTRGPRVNGQTLPHVEGDVDLDRAVILFDFANQSENERIAATTQPLFWTYRLHVRATSNLRWQPPDADMEFSADLVLDQSESELRIYGDMTELRGTYHFLSNTFTVSKANLTFDNVGGVNPTIDAEASTQILPTQGVTGEALGESPQVHTVTVTVTGRSDHPDIAFQTSPADWDEARILRELTLGRFLDRGSVALGDPLDNYLTRKLNDQLSPLLSKAFVGYVNQWRIEREQGGLLYGQGDVVLTVRSQVNNRLLLSYANVVPGFARTNAAGVAPITGSFDRKVEAEYRLNRFFFVTTELAQRRGFTGTLNSATGGTDFNVNLKARWEY